EKPAEAPPKRGRGKKQTTDTAPEPDPKTARGRRGKVTVDQQDAEPEQTVPEAPKTRGRPKKSATVPKEKTEDKPAKRGRGKATKTELEIEKVPVKQIAETAKKAYWLMKAEPESRLENGVDVKFSIDDLAARAEPEPWDGVRNHVAKKNMQAMQKGDLAFFYHSSCKEPGVVGIMEIVEGPQPDESAFDPNHPYYDPKSKRERPTWFCVKVAFRSKFTNPERVTLSKLKELKGQGGTPVDNIQLLTTTRLSVTRVLPHEWEYILGLA
ncbi:DUF55-domain-containing protein, partial [Saccharata proteae CBS 121410]